MDHPVLVDIDVNEGASIVQALNEEDVKFDVALWATFPEYYDPRLVFAAEWLDQFDPLTRYKKFGEALATKSAVWNSSPIQILKMTDPFIVALRQRYKGMSNLWGTRLRNAYLGGRYLEDGYIYLVR